MKVRQPKHHIMLRQENAALRYVRKSLRGAQHKYGRNITGCYVGANIIAWYCQLFREFERRLSPTMRQHHVAGDKAFVDFSGKKIPITDPTTGVMREAEIFVAVLGASNLTYAEATWTQAFARMDRRARAHVPLLGCELPPAGARQSQERREQGLILRSRGQPQLWCNGCTLRCRHPASTAASPEGQSQSRGRRPHSLSPIMLGRLRNVTFFSLAECNAAIAVAWSG